MATTRKRDERARALSRETLIGRDVLYVMTDGTTVRPAKIVDIDDARDDAELRATLAIFTAGDMDRGLVEHAERGDGGGREPTVIVRRDVLSVQEPLEGAHEFQGTNRNRCAVCGDVPVDPNGNLTHPRTVLWPGHTWHAPPETVAVRVSGTAPTEAPPATGSVEGTGGGAIVARLPIINEPASPAAQEPKELEAPHEPDTTP